MKKVIYLLICLSVVIGITSIVSFGTNVEGEMVDKGKIFINDVEIEDIFLIKEDFVWKRTMENRMVQTDTVVEIAYLPFRAIFEALGATVDWETETNNIIINYLGEFYICEFDEFIKISNENISNGALGTYLRLHPMASGGTYEMINDTIYLLQDTGQRLYEALGCSVEIDLPNRVLKIYAPNYIPKEIRITLNGKPIQFDIAPFNENERILVPLRVVFEALGATVDWDESTQTVTVRKGDIIILLQINSNELIKNGKSIYLDVPARLVDGSTFVPIRAVAESFGAMVEWDEDTKTIVINN